MFEKFIFNGRSTDDFGIMCVEFSNESISKTYSSQSELSTELSGSGLTFSISSHKYSEPIKFDVYFANKDGTDFTLDKVEEISNWLCLRNTYKQLVICENGHEDVIYNAIFINPKLIEFGRIIGVKFEVLTDSPFCKTNYKKYTFGDFSEESLIILYSNSVNGEYIYPLITMETITDGTIELRNTTDNPTRILEIRNCVAGEKITIDCNKPSISSSILDHDVYTDTNKKWARLVNGENILIINNIKNITFEYQELRRTNI